MYNRYSGVFSFVIVHDNPQYGGVLYTVTGYCQATCCHQLDLKGKGFFSLNYPTPAKLIFLPPGL